jgi:hypothetical protein
MLDEGRGYAVISLFAIGAASFGSDVLQGPVLIVEY